MGNTGDPARGGREIRDCAATVSSVITGQVRIPLNLK